MYIGDNYFSKSIVLLDLILILKIDNLIKLWGGGVIDRVPTLPYGPEKCDGVKLVIELYKKDISFHSMNYTIK